MYRLEMSLSVDGKGQVIKYDPKYGVPSQSGQTIFHLNLSSEQLSDIAQALTFASQKVQDWSSPKDSQPGKPVADQAAFTPGEDTYDPKPAHLDLLVDLSKLYSGLST